jgi:UDP:flavonoid glycosyltransferase YjiC (YdhE family)
MRGAAPRVSARRRILFCAEAVTLAHVTRPYVLARSLDSAQYEIHFACADGFDWLLNRAGFTRHSLRSITPGRFMRALANGSPLYDLATLEGYVREDMELIGRIKPDIVVGDFRLSLAVSAARAQVPYVALANAHWSPYAQMRYPLPEHPLARILGVPLADALFQLVQPIAFAIHALPMNRLRRRHGLAPLGSLQSVYTHGDRTLYCDTPGLVPTEHLPAHHMYIGPVLWSPDSPLPDWWHSLPEGRPIVYVTLGSSGQVERLPEVIAVLGDLPVTAMVATAGRARPTALPVNVFCADYLPGIEAARRAALVICNGGSATAYQALAAGTPVLGLCSNLDQYLTMQCIERHGAGRLLRSGKTARAMLRAVIGGMLAEPDCREAAARAAQEFTRYDAPARFTACMECL